MGFLSNRIERLSDSQTLMMTQKCRELKSKGIDVINLSIGETDFFTPGEVKEAAKTAIDQNYSFYSPVSGYDDLKQAICKKLKENSMLNYLPEQVVVSNGAKQTLANIIMCLVNHGDEVIIPVPYWVSYIELVKLADGKPVELYSSIDHDFKITPGELDKIITPKTKAIFFNSPSNPTGSVYKYEELKAIAAVLAKYPHVFIISDEIYEHIIFEGKHETLAQFEEIRERVIVVNGVSKGYAMTGWRIGFMAGPKWLAKACIKLQGQTTSGACSVSQRAALAALNSGGEFINDMQTTFKRRRDLILKHMDEIPGLKHTIPQGAFYVFPNISYYIGKSDGERKICNDDDLTYYLLDKAFVAVVPGNAFGDPQCIRISYATSDENLVKAMVRIKEALGKLK